MIQGIKKHGLKAALPLLLLSTACSDGTLSSQEFDVIADEAYEEAVASIKADESVYAGLQAIEAAAVAEEAQAEAEAELVEQVEHAPKLKAEAVKRVPEPTTMAGLAIAGLSLGALKRKQSA